MLLDTRWILHEELGILGRSEEEAAADVLDDALGALNRASDELAEIAAELGASPAHPEALADGLTHEVIQRTREFLQASGPRAAETFFLTACTLVLAELAAAADAARASQLSIVVSQLTRALDRRLTAQAFTGASSPREAARELLPIWRSLAGEIGG